MTQQAVVTGVRRYERGEPLRIVHVIPQIGVGGAEGQLRALIARMPRSAATHRVYYYGESLDEEGYESYREAGISFTRVSRSRRNPLRLLRGLATAIRTDDPHIVHCWLPGGALWGRFAAVIAGAPHVIVSFRNSRISLARWLAFAERFTPRRAHYLVNSRAGAIAAAEALAIPTGRFEVIHNGIDATPYPAEARRRPLPWTVVNVARLSAQKNHEMLLRLARRCRGVLPVRFRLVGHGELEHSLRAQARRLGVDDLVEFLGLRRDVPTILGEADVFCFTSAWEGFPNALLEAMASTLPIVSTRFAGADELIVDGVSGSLVAPDDDAAAFAALSRYVHEPDLATSHARAARARTEREFSMERMVASTLACYERIAGA